MMFRIVLLAIFSNFFISCAPLKPHEVVETHLNALEKANTEHYSGLYQTYEDEKKYLDNSWPPKYGLALSGGGTRSASFSIGALKALNEAEILQKIDVISSVSGGSYATYWYFSQQFYQDIICSRSSKYCFNDKDIFRQWSESATNLESPNKYRFQHLLEESSNILTHAHKPSLWNDTKNILQLGFMSMIQGLSTPIHWLANGVFDTEINITPFFYFYKDGLDRTYGYVPLDYTMENFANAENAFFFLVKNLDAVPITFDDIKLFLDKRKENDKKTPYLIINTTARYGRWFNRYGSSKRTLQNSTFEFTPWGCYSKLIKDNACPKARNPFIKRAGVQKIDFAKAVTISGAAVDGQFQVVDISGNIEDPYELPIYLSGKNIFELGLDIANLNLGHQVSFPDESIQHNVHTLIHKVLPWPLYILDDALLWDKNSATSLYLTDGGHSENLGILSLIKRGVENIIIVDAENDGLSTFSSAKLIEKTLNKFNLCIELSQNNGDLIDVYNSDAKKSSFRGIIVEYQDKNHGCIDNKSVRTIKHRFVYIKLASNSRHANKSASHGDELIPFSVRKYKEINPNFPHDSTADVFYSREQFRAYRDLGFLNTKKAIEKYKNFLNF